MSWENEREWENFGILTNSKKNIKDESDTFLHKLYKIELSEIFIILSNCNFSFNVAFEIVSRICESFCQEVREIGI